MNRLLHDGPSAWAMRQPDAVALVANGERLTYGALEAASNRLARLLREAGCARGDRVALIMPKSFAAIVGMLGVSKADCIYVPIDTSMPAARAARIVSKSDARWILGAGRTSRLIAELVSDRQLRGGREGSPIHVGWLDACAPDPAGFTPVFDRSDLERASSEPRAYECSAEDLVHLLFTSGSTGEPKGVMITHSNVLHFLDWAIRYFDMRPGERNSSHPPLHFDLSTFDVYGTLTAGGELHLVAPELNLLPHKLAAFIRESELTQWFSVPSILSHMAGLDVVRMNDFPSLKRLLWCGEVFPTRGLMYWMRRLPHVTFTNLYGPTEATIASSFYTLPGCPSDEREEVPIGTACAGEELLVLDDNRDPVPPEQVGELYLRGVGLSPGYWRDPEITAAAFRPNPRTGDPADRVYRTGDLARVGRDGLVYYLGRADSQIKSRGYRIELGEIETALNSIPGLLEAAVVGVKSDGFEGTAICCAYAASSTTSLTPASLRTQLSRLLPSYMLPARWMALAPLPKNQNGKIDRRRLKELFDERLDEATPFDTSSPGENADGRALRSH